MDPRSLNEKLLKEFHLVCFSDLTELQETHGAIFHLFKHYHKERFENNERFVFYSEFNPTQELINHIQRAAFSVDISNFFILFVTPFDLKEKIEIANKTYSNTEFPTLMQYRVEPITGSMPLAAPKNIASYETICPLPFMHNDITIHNDIKVCWLNPLKIGNIKTNSLLEAFNTNKDLLRLREDLKAGKKPSLCNKCWQTEHLSSTSLRQHLLTKHEKELDFYLIDNPDIKNVDLSPSNSCNFKCRICMPFASNTFGAEVIKYSHSENEKQKIRIFDEQAQKNTPYVINAIKSVADTISRLHIMGGEPFLWDGLNELLNYLISSRLSNNIRLEFNSNGSIYPTNIENIVEHFDMVEILLSIDDIGPRFELERGGQWSHVYNNILKYINLRNKFQNVKVKLVPTINIQNLLYLHELFVFAQKLNFPIGWAYLFEPTHFCIDYIPAPVKELVYLKYNKHEDPELRNISTRVCSTPPDPNRQFIQEMLKYDSYRKQDFRTTHAELYQAFTKDQE